MPIATLQFDLPEETEAFAIATQASDVMMALREFEQDLRNWHKHSHPFQTADEAVDKIRDRFYLCLSEYRVDF